MSPANSPNPEFIRSLFSSISSDYDKSQEKAMAGGEVVAPPAFTFCMNFDRRIVTGAQATRFFNSVCEKLPNPQVMES